MVRLMGLENNKALHKIRTVEKEHTGFTYIGWSRNLAGKRRSGAARKLLSEFEAPIRRGEGGVGGKEELLDLERDLTFLEVETALPKLSPLPVSGGSGCARQDPIAPCH